MVKPQIQDRDGKVVQYLSVSVIIDDDTVIVVGRVAWLSLESTTDHASLLLPPKPRHVFNECWNVGE